MLKHVIVPLTGRPKFGVTDARVHAVHDGRHKYYNKHYRNTCFGTQPSETKIKED